jgi:hypothetical protein
MSVADRVVLITGAARGLGFEYAAFWVRPALALSQATSPIAPRPSVQPAMARSASRWTRPTSYPPIQWSNWRWRASTISAR